VSTSASQDHPLFLDPVRDRVRRVAVFVVLLALVATIGWQTGRVVGFIYVPDPEIADHLHSLETP
jgi:hypothetical protein